jgi:hypothetical protein
MKEILLKLVFVSLGLIFFVGCEKGPDDDEIFEQRKNEYARWIDDRMIFFYFNNTKRKETL